MSIVKIKDKKFKTSIPEKEILKKVKAVADRINHDMADKNPLLLAVLNGSFVFAADLMRMINIPSEISFVKLESYAGTSTTGKVTEVLGLTTDITNRHVIVVEDIVESGLTMQRMLDTLNKHNPASVEICTLLLKPERLCISNMWPWKFPTTSSWVTVSTMISKVETCATSTRWLRMTKRNMLRR